MNNSASIPQHIAVIMDGNGRWAQARGLSRIEGHKAGALSVRKLVEESRRIGIRYLTLYSFSSENWYRSPEEVAALMGLFRQYLDTELEGLLDNGIRLRAIGDLSRLPFGLRRALYRAVKATEKNEGLDLILAVSYGSRDEIVNATKKIALKAKKGLIDPQKINTQTFSENLYTAGLPDPDLLIRTSGEMRISNFLLWQIAYSEIIVLTECWPDFNEDLLHKCLDTYRSRERRFGLTSAQITQAESNC
ncbi:MAG: isoprenyl transferase [Deltaproteobacteria bacterium]|nr:isoprenyl transferase [Deltaproteobacteria bacterium]